MRILTLTLLLLINVIFGQVSFLTTIKPFRLILEEVAGDRAVVIQLIPDGASPHTFELKPSDMKNAGKAIAFFSGSENLDHWAEELPVLNRIELLSLVPESFLQRITTSEDGASSGIDPHFWLDPLAVKSMLPALLDELTTLDPGGRKIYYENTQRFGKELDSLYNRNRILFATVEHNFLLSHPFFIYFMRRFNLTVVDVIEPIPGKEPSPRRLMELIKESKKKNVKAILVNPQLSQRPAEIISGDTGFPIIELYPLGSRTEQGDYFSLLNTNVDILLKEIND